MQKGGRRKVADNGFGMDPCSVIMIKVKEEKRVYMSVERGVCFSRGIIFPLERITFFYPAFVCTHKKTKGKVIDLFSLFVVQKNNKCA